MTNEIHIYTHDMCVRLAFLKDKLVNINLKKKSKKKKSSLQKHCVWTPVHKDSDKREPV